MLVIVSVYCMGPLGHGFNSKC